MKRLRFLALKPLEQAIVGGTVILLFVSAFLGLQAYQNTFASWRLEAAADDLETRIAALQSGVGLLDLRERNAFLEARVGVREADLPEDVRPSDVFSKIGRAAEGAGVALVLVEEQGAISIEDVLARASTSPGAEESLPKADVPSYQISGFRVEAKGSTDQIELLLSGLGAEDAGPDLALEEIEIVREGDRWVVRLMASVLGARK